MNSQLETNLQPEILSHTTPEDSAKKLQQICARYSLLILLLISITKVDAQKRTVITIDDPSDIGFGKEALLNSHLNAVINGGLVHGDNTCVGGFVDNRISYFEGKKKKGNDGKIVLADTTKTKNKGNFSYHNAVLGKTIQGEMKIFEYGDPQINATKFEWAFQNGPFLLKEGSSSHLKDSAGFKKIRSGIGYTADKKLVYIKTDESVTFQEFAKLFLLEDVFNAIYLDGGVEEFIGFSAKDQEGNQYNNTMKKDRPVLQFFHTNVEVQKKE